MSDILKSQVSGETDDIPPSQGSGETDDALPSQVSGETDEREDVQQFLQHCGNGVAVLKEYLESRLDEWKITPASIAIVGEPGVGKSTFINTVRGVKADDEEAAPVGVVQTAIEPKAYPHPANPNIIMWELPGFGCPDLPTDTYLDLIDLDIYDMFILIWARRFTDDAIRLAEELDRRQKRYFLACTKFDEIIESEPAVGDRAMRDRVRENIKWKLRERQIYFISGSEREKFDFKNLTQDLLHSLLSIKREKSKTLIELQSELDMRKNTPVAIGIIGESGVGKSSFINAVRGLTADDEGGAAVGVTETTKEPTKYTHPSNSNVIFWDLPGVGTPQFKKENYMERIKVKTYDAFVIMSARRFTEHDAWLAEEIELRGRQSFFVQCKFDEVFREWSENKAEGETLDKLMEDLKLPLQRQLKKNIYLISNYYSDLYDFPLLMTDILNDLPDIKKESLTLTLGMLSEKLINEKKAVLKSRIPKAAALSAAVGALPVPGFDVAADCAILVHEKKLYQKTFGIDDDSIKRLAKSHGIDIGHLEKAVTKTRGIMSGSKGAAKVAVWGSRIGIAFAAKSAATTVLEVAVPVVGTSVSALVSYGMTYAFLSSMLNDHASDALAVYQAASKKLVDKTEIELKSLEVHES